MIFVIIDSSGMFATEHSTVGSGGERGGRVKSPAERRFGVKPSNDAENLREP